MSDNSELQQNLHAQQQQQIAHKTDFCSELISQKRTDFGGWSFLQALTNTTQTPEKEKEKEQVYVHPLVKKSASMLSEKSLEMCTESLGSETGSIISDGGDELMSSSFVSDIEKSRRIPCFSMIRERSTSISSFPPPITTIRGGSSGAFQVESQRQDGRLVMKAVSVSTNQSCFMAERKDGRLKLRFLDNSDELDDEGNHEFVQEDESYDDQLINGVEECRENVGDEAEVNNISRRNRCNEEGAGRRCKELQNWEPFLVATS